MVAVVADVERPSLVQNKQTFAAGAHRAAYNVARLPPGRDGGGLASATAFVIVVAAGSAPRKSPGSLQKQNGHNLAVASMLRGLWLPRFGCLANRSLAASLAALY